MKSKFGVWCQYVDGSKNGCWYGNRISDPGSLYDTHEAATRAMEKLKRALSFPQDWVHEVREVRL